MNKRLKEWIESITEAIILAIILFFLFWPTLITGSSMENTFFTGDRVMISRVLVYLNKIDYSDIIVCKINEKGTQSTIIKRLIGLPNDHIIMDNGILYVNGTKVDEPYLKDGYSSGNIDIVLGSDEYFVLGDNRKVSLDSRTIGPISSKEIVGKVLLRWYPLKNIKMY